MTLTDTDFATEPAAVQFRYLWRLTRLAASIPRLQAERHRFAVGDTVLHVWKGETRKKPLIVTDVRVLGNLLPHVRVYADDPHSLYHVNAPVWAFIPATETEGTA